MIRRRGWVVAKLAVSAGLLYVIVQGVSLDEVWQAIRSADTALLVIAFAMFFLGYAITALRWRLLLGAQGVTASYGYLLRSFMVAVFFNNFLPSTIGGDAVRAYDTWRAGGGKLQSVAIVFTDRLFGLMALASFALVAAWAASQGVPELVALRWLLLVVFLAILVVLGILFGSWPMPARITVQMRLPGSLQGIVERVGQAVAAFRGRQDVLGRALLLSFVLQANVVFHYILLGWALHLAVPWYAFFLIVPLALVIMMVPVSINGIGVREGIFVYMLGWYGVSEPDALALAWIAFGFVLLQGLIGALVYALRREMVVR